MNDDQETEEQPSKGFSLDSIYYVLFKRKWIIVFFLIAAMGCGATLLFVIKPQQFHSEAQVWIRYVAETRAPSVTPTEGSTRMLNGEDDSIVNTEIDILRSMDLAQKVVRMVGADRILAKLNGGNNFDDATAVVRGNMTVDPLPRRSVLAILFRHPDPEIAREVLGKIIVAYAERHREMRNPLELGDFYSNETQRLTKDLALTEQRLKEARIKAGVASVEESRKSFTDQISGLNAELIKAKAELAGFQSIVNERSSETPTNAVPTTNVTVAIPTDIRNNYKQILDRLEALSKQEADLRVTFLEGTIQVQTVQATIATEKQRRQKLENEYPGLTALAISPSQQSGQPAGATDPATAAIQVRSVSSKIQVLESQLVDIRADLAKAEGMEGEITELQRKKEFQEADLKRFSASMDQQRIDAQLGAGNALNISIIESPTPPRKMWSKNLLKKAGMLSGGCAAFGFALAFALEFVLDRSIKRPSDIETRLRLPLLISIPDLSRNGHRKTGKGKKPLPRVDVMDQEPAAAAGAKTSPPAGTMAVALWDREDNLRRFCEGLRDRVIIDFDIKNVTHKPKLVAVTSCHRGAGVTSIATGLTAALSESGSGNAMLVDMNDDRGRSTRYRRGKMTSGPEERWERGSKSDKAPEPDFHDTHEAGAKDRLPSNLPRAFANLLPNLKAGDFDYIVFDMPPVTQTSMTVRLAGIMDCVLLVVESEKTNQESVQQAIGILTKSKAYVTTVLNKVRTYVPTRLYQDFLGEN